MRARSSVVILKDGIQRADRVCLRLWVFLELIWRNCILTVYIQALQFGEIKEMADRAGLFKYVLSGRHE